MTVRQKKVAWISTTLFFAFALGGWVGELVGQERDDSLRAMVDSAFADINRGNARLEAALEAMMDAGLEVPPPNPDPGDSVPPPVASAEGALWGWNREMLDGVVPELCFLTEPGYEADLPGTLQWCIDQPGPQLVICRLGAAEDDGEGYRGIRTRDAEGLKIVAGISCPGGKLPIRGRSDELAAGAASAIEHEGGDGLLLADVEGWDSKCYRENPRGTEFEGHCTFDEQKLLKVWAGNFASIRSAWHMNSADDIAGITTHRRADTLTSRVLFYQTAIGPVSKIARSPEDGIVRGGEGQCMPISVNANKVLILQTWGLACGHRVFTLGGHDIYIAQSGGGGWGGRNMEAGGRLNVPGDPGATTHVTAAIDDFTYLGNMPPITRQISFMLRPLRYPSELEGIKAGLVQIWVGRVQGSDELGQPYRETWSGSDAWLERARCDNSAVPVDECRDRDGIPFSEIEVVDWFADEPPFPLPEVPAIGSAYDHNILQENLGPRYRRTCEGELELVGPSPLLAKMLRHAREGTSPAGNGFPTRPEAWHEPWPDNALEGENCVDANENGVPDLEERRISLACYGEVREVGHMDDCDADGVPWYQEALIDLTDPTVSDRR